MSARTPLPRLSDIRQSIQWIADDTSGYDEARFTADRRVRQTVERNVEIISEASRRIPDELKARYPQIPWRSIAGIGNIIRHDYERVEPKLLWQIVVKDLPALSAAIDELIRELEG